MLYTENKTIQNKQQQKNPQNSIPTFFFITKLNNNKLTSKFQALFYLFFFKKRIRVILKLFYVHNV